MCISPALDINASDFWPVLPRLLIATFLSHSQLFVCSLPSFCLSGPRSARSPPRRRTCWLACSVWIPPSAWVPVSASCTPGSPVSVKPFTLSLWSVLLLCVGFWFLGLCVFLCGQVAEKMTILRHFALYLLLLLSHCLLFLQVSATPRSTTSTCPKCRAICKHASSDVAARGKPQCISCIIQCDCLVGETLGG